MTLIELLKITDDSTHVTVRTRMYGLEADFNGYPLSLIGSGQEELLLREVKRQWTKENGWLVILLKE